MHGCNWFYLLKEHQWLSVLVVRISAVLYNFRIVCETMSLAKSKGYFAQFRQVKGWRPIEVKSFSGMTALALYLSGSTLVNSSQQVFWTIFKTCNTSLFSHGHWLLSLRLSNKNMTTANTITLQHEWIKMILIFIIPAHIYIYFFLCYRVLLISLCVVKWKMLKITDLESYQSREW